MKMILYVGSISDELKIETKAVKQKVHFFEEYWDRGRFVTTFVKSSDVICSNVIQDDLWEKRRFLFRQTKTSMESYIAQLECTLLHT